MAEELSLSSSKSLKSSTMSSIGSRYSSYFLSTKRVSDFFKLNLNFSFNFITNSYFLQKFNSDN